MGHTSLAPVIVLGAACSGTRILRKLLGAHSALTEIPWDINYLWKLGETEIRHDELDVGHATEAKRRLLEKFFASRARPGTQVLEKTVSNTLRVEFVRALFPEARFIHIIRDGRDVAVSARRRWRSLPNPASLGAKLLHFPLRAIPTYGISYVRAQIPRLLSRQDHVAAWGPMPRGLPDRLEALSLIETCGVQWASCAAKAAQDLEADPRIRYRAVRYDEFARHPLGEIEKLLHFLELELEAEVGRAARQVHASAVEAWREELNRQEIDRLMPHIDGTLRRFGYLSDP